MIGTGVNLFRWIRELRTVSTGVATAAPHSLTKICNQTRKKPMFMGISCAHTAKHRATFAQRVTRSSKPPIRREEAVSDGNWCQLFAKAAMKAAIEFVGNVPIASLKQFRD
jgi:hypothetical protein